MLYAFFWVIPWRLNFICRCLGTLFLFHLHRRVGTKNSSSLPACEDGTECTETSACKTQTPGNYPEESIHFQPCFLREKMLFCGSSCFECHYYLTTNFNGMFTDTCSFTWIASCCHFLWAVQDSNSFFW